MPLQVSFAHDRPDDTEEHQRFFRGPIRFAAGSNSMLLSADDAARPLRGADAALSAIVRRRLDRVLADRDWPALALLLSARVRRLLLKDLGQATTLSADLAAKALTMSRRTLTRRLAEEGTSFRAILDDVRAEFARALLLDRTLSIADIAFFLQYSEPAAFHRSFRRWTGQTPQRLSSDLNREREACAWANCPEIHQHFRETRAGNLLGSSGARSGRSFSASGGDRCPTRGAPAARSP